MKFSIKDFFDKYDQIRSYLWIWSHSLKKSSMENFIFCAVTIIDSKGGQNSKSIHYLKSVQMRSFF